MSALRTVSYAITAAAAAAGVLAAYTMLQPGASRATFEAVDVTGAPWGKGFDLTDHHGRRRTLADFRGKVVTLFFGFTKCPDICPTTMAMLGEALRRLGPDADKVQGLFVTVDPRRDTPQVLAKYVPAFFPSFLGLYGDENATARAAGEFKVYFKAHPPDHHGSYGVEHSGQVFVFDRGGRLRLFISSTGATPEAVARDLKILLREPAQEGGKDASD